MRQHCSHNVNQTFLYRGRKSAVQFGSYTVCRTQFYRPSQRHCNSYASCYKKATSPLLSHYAHVLFYQIHGFYVQISTCHKCQTMDQIKTVVGLWTVCSYLVMSTLRCIYHVRQYDSIRLQFGCKNASLQLFRCEKLRMHNFFKLSLGFGYCLCPQSQCRLLWINS